MDQEKFLQIIRDQLQIMTNFMASTPCTKAHQDAFYWMGDLPAAVSLYTPIKWQEKNHSIHSIWAEYLSEIEKAELHERVTKANALQIADLLAASLGVEEEMSMIARLDNG